MMANTFAGATFEEPSKAKRKAKGSGSTFPKYGHSSHQMTPTNAHWEVLAPATTTKPVGPTDHMEAEEDMAALLEIALAARNSALVAPVLGAMVRAKCAGPIKPVRAGSAYTL